MKSNSRVRYYVYISRSKVNMLYQQIPQKILSRLEKKVVIDLKLVKLTFKEEPYDDTLYSKLNIVISYLESTSRVGDIFSPSEYFKGNLYLAWTEIYEGVVFWGGQINNTVLGLGGSLKNTIGYESSGVERGISNTPWLVSLLAREIESIIQPKEVVTNEFISSGSKEFERRIIASTRHWADKLSLRSYQRFEFVAKKLRYRDYYGRRVLLGTPIYMAVTEE